MSTVSSEGVNFNKVTLQTLIGDVMEVEQYRMAEVGKAYFDTPFEEDIHFIPLDTPNQMMMVHIPFEAQTYIAIRQTDHSDHGFLFKVYYRVLDAEGRVYLENRYYIKKVVDIDLNCEHMYRHISNCILSDTDSSFVWVVDKVESSPRLPTFAALADFIAAQTWVSNPSLTSRAIALEQEFLTNRLKIEWNRLKVNYELEEMYRSANETDLDMVTALEKIKEAPMFANNPYLASIDFSNMISTTTPKNKLLPVFRHLVSDDFKNDAAEVMSFSQKNIEDAMNQLENQCIIS